MCGSIHTSYADKRIVVVVVETERFMKKSASTAGTRLRAHFAQLAGAHSTECLSERPLRPKCISSSSSKKTIVQPARRYAGCLSDDRGALRRLDVGCKADRPCRPNRGTERREPKQSATASRCGGTTGLQEQDHRTTFANMRE